VSVHDDCQGATVVVAVDVGKNTVALSVTGPERHRLLGPLDFAMTRPGLSSTIARVHDVLPPGSVVKVGIEAAGHYHRPLLTPSAWPVGWEVLELNPAHVGEQRRVQGRRRVKTDAIDLEAIAELVLAGRGVPVTGREQVIGELAAWSAHRTRRVATRTATKNQLLGQLDRSFPGLTLALPDVLGTMVGRLVADEFADPARCPRSARRGSCASLPPGGCGCGPRWRSGWSLLLATRCPPLTRRWPAGCWPRI
jgi:transposase